jgi:serine/threonine-protein kinase
MAVKIADFGIARASEQTRLTQVGSVVGTAAYLSPEQSRGEEATGISDVDSVGVVVYQMLTGRLPSGGNSLAELAIRRENERPLPPSSYEPDVPPELSAAVLRALENEPEDRYVDALALAAALRGGLAGVAPSAEATTRALTESRTAPTRVEPREPKTPVAPVPATRRRQPQHAERPPSRAAAQPRAQNRGRSAFAKLMRAIGAVLLIAIVAAIVAAVILLATDAGSNTDAADFIRDTFNGQIDAFQQFIEDNTR